MNPPEPNSKPICPLCHRKAINHYIRKGNSYISQGFWCTTCQRPVSNEENVHTFNVKSYINNKKRTQKSDIMGEEIDFTYLQQPPRKWTFSLPEVRNWIESNAYGKVLNLFAGKIRLSLDEIRVDLDSKHHPDYVMEADKAVDMFITRGNMFDTVIMDPPYSHRKAWEKYKGNYIKSFTKLKNKLPQILNENGIVISLGYDTTGMGNIRGFRKTAICLINHAALHKDTIGLVEVKVSRPLPDPQ